MQRRTLYDLLADYEATMHKLRGEGTRTPKSTPSWSRAPAKSSRSLSGRLIPGMKDTRMKPIDTFELPSVPSLVTSLDWHETIKQFARDSIRKYLEESGFARHLSRSDAWGEVVAVLDEVAPGWWRECKSTGEACAVAAIRKLAADAARAPKEPRPFDLEAAMRGEPIVTRDGRRARFIAYVPEAVPSGRVVAMIEGCDLPFLYCEDGTCISCEPKIQLFMEP